MTTTTTQISPHDLRAWRMLSGLTQEAAANRLQVPARTYIGWENGQRVSHPHLLALALAAVHEGLPPWETPADIAPTPKGRGRPRKAVVI